MKTRIIKSIFTLILSIMVLPVLSQDFMVIYLKDGDIRKFYLKSITEIVPSKVDSEGITHSDFRSQRISTIYDTYVYNLEDVDSITFTKISEEQSAINFQTAVHSALLSLSDCETAEDAESHINEIKSSEGVEDAWCNNGNCFIKIKDGETISFHFGHSLEDSESDAARPVEQSRAFLPPKKIGLKSDGNKLKVAIVNQQYNDDSRKKNITNYFDPLISDLRYCGIDVDPINDLKIDFFYRSNDKPNEPTIFDYDMTFLITHGDYDGNSHNLLLSKELGMEKKQSKNWSADFEKNCREKLIEFRNTALGGILGDLDCVKLGFNEEERNGETYWVCYVNLKECFFTDKAKDTFKNPNSILFNIACQSIYLTPSFKDVFLTKMDLGFYLGYTESNYLGQKTGYEFFSSLLSGVSLDKAYNDLPWYHKTEYLHSEGARLLLFPEDNKAKNTFIFSPITNPVDPVKATNEFNSQNYVEVEGLATILNANDPKVLNALSYGFEFENKSEDGLAWTRMTTKDIRVLSKTIDKGNVLFKGQLTNLERNKTYSYRAFTSDGDNYNYGNTCSFKIEDEVPPVADLALSSTTPISLKTGESATIEITSGSGSYDIDNKNPSVVSVILNGNAISITALSADVATIIVTDTKSGQTQTITVTVKADESSSLKCPDNNHPHIIDLGMPSGTKWACCNIGAGKPEDYGEYFAWGETGAKGKYNWSTYKYCDGSDNCYDIGMNISGSQYDVARAKWGTTWSMPNSEQMMELIYCCTHEWTTYNGVNGYLFTGSNGQSIFMPATGKMYGDWPNYEKGDEGNYWSSSRSSNHDYLACYFQFSSKGVSWSNYIGRYYGFSVRPITSGNQQSIPDLALESTSPVSLVVGESKMIKIVSGSGKYVYGHENNGIVSVDINGSIITINALKAGEIVVTITDTESGQQAKISVTVINGSTPMDNIPAEAVDLGLPSGTKWASYNVGATKPEEYGGYYAWGETEEKDVYNITTYAFYIGNDWQTCENLGEIAGTQYDVAHVKWGGNWTMPSANQIEELVTVCTSEWEERNGIKGRCFTGPNGKSIFLPAAGYRMLGGLTGLGSTGQYWTSSQIESDIIYNAYELYFFSGRASWPVEGSRFLGNSVRPVWNK